MAGGRGMHSERHSPNRNELRRFRFVNFVLFCGNWLVEEKGGAEGEREEIGQALDGGSRSLVGQDVFLDLEFVAAEIDEQAVLQAGGFQIAEDLGHVFVNYLTDSFEFDDEPAVHKEVGIVFAQQGAVFIIDLERVLLLDGQAELAETMG